MQIRKGKFIILKRNALYNNNNVKVYRCRKHDQEIINYTVKIITLDQDQLHSLNNFLLSQPTHPNVLSIQNYYINQSQRQIFIFTRLYPQTLYKAIQQHKIGIPQIIKLLTQMIAAIEHLNSLGYSHFDIKPQNIFMDQKGNFILGDLGSAMKLDKVNKQVFIQHTKEYMAPELDSQDLDYSIEMLKKIDIYCLGIIIREDILQGFSSDWELLDQVVNKMTQKDPRVRIGLTDLLKCLGRVPTMLNNQKNNQQGNLRTSNLKILYRYCQQYVSLQQTLRQANKSFPQSPFYKRSQALYLLFVAITLFPPTPFNHSLIKLLIRRSSSILNKIKPYALLNDFLQNLQRQKEWMGWIKRELQIQNESKGVQQDDFLSELSVCVMSVLQSWFRGKQMGVWMTVNYISLKRQERTLEWRNMIQTVVIMPRQQLIRNINETIHILL